METYNKKVAEQRLEEGKALIQDKPTYAGKSYVAQLYRLHQLLIHTKKHEEALQESWTLTETSVDIKKCNAYGVEGRFGGARVDHPTARKFREEFNKLCKSMQTELDEFKRTTGYECAYYHKIVNKKVNDEWKKSNKS